MRFNVAEIENFYILETKNDKKGLDTSLKTLIVTSSLTFNIIITLSSVIKNHNE